jgi:hypothetical protein
MGSGIVYSLLSPTCLGARRTVLKRFKAVKEASRSPTQRMKISGKLALVCTAGPGAVAAAGYVPLVTRPGKTVPCIRAQISVPTPSTVSVAATFEYKDHRRARSIASPCAAPTTKTSKLKLKVVQFLTP